MSITVFALSSSSFFGFSLVSKVKAIRGSYGYVNVATQKVSVAPASSCLSSNNVSLIKFFASKARTGCLPAISITPKRTSCVHCFCFDAMSQSNALRSAAAISRFEIRSDFLS